LGAGMRGGRVGAPELFLLRSLLFSVDSMGCPPWLVATFVKEDGPVCEADRSGGLGLLEDTVGLNVTVRCGLGGLALVAFEPCANEEINGVVSVELDAMTSESLAESAGFS
jgi:hypothetical protein